MPDTKLGDAVPYTPNQRDYLTRCTEDGRMPVDKFDVAALDIAWVTDTAYIRTCDGFAYLAVVIDLYSRRVTG